MIVLTEIESRIAASMYAILMAVTNVAQGVGMFISGSLSDLVGFRWVFLIMGALNLLAVPVIGLIHQGKSET